MTLGLSPGDHVLAIPTHPDDETLGAGGTIARLTGEGVHVHVLAVACCQRRRWGAASTTGQRAGEFEAACDVLGVSGRRIAWLDTEQARNVHHHLPELIQLIEDGPELSLNALRPAALFIPAAGAVHQEHQLVHRAAYAAARPGGTARHCPRLVLGFDGPEDRAWSSEAGPRAVLVDITASAAAKDRALECYASQLREASHPRNLERIRAFDAAAGAGIGAGRAEAFTAYRMAW
ncbi:PIG-L deacetylase family protein [Kitasatospora sp. NPDC050463]|uniref:PIG-L deacetylase family protein n=1 Tax=Kitasatospora sp. NPDC050463 TaxID=3155786 RepID=UPI00340CDF55